MHLAPHDAFFCSVYALARAKSGLALGAAPRGVSALQQSIGRIYALAKDQQGCRFLQRQIEGEDSADAVTIILTETLPHLTELMTGRCTDAALLHYFFVLILRSPLVRCL